MHNSPDTRTIRTGQACAHGYWLGNSHVSVKVSGIDISLLEHLLPFEDAPPFHVHREEDEIFHVLDGEVRFRVGDDILTKRAGATLFAPRQTPHGYRVVSPEGACFLTITRGGFEAMIRELGRPARAVILPEVTVLSPDMQMQFAARSLAHGIELIGPPID